MSQEPPPPRPEPLDYASPDARRPNDNRGFHRAMLISFAAGVVASAVLWPSASVSNGTTWAVLPALALGPVKLLVAAVLTFRGGRASGAGLGLLLSLPIGALIFLGTCGK